MRALCFHFLLCCSDLLLCFVVRGIKTPGFGKLAFCSEELIFFLCIYFVFLFSRDKEDWKRLIIFFVERMFAGAPAHPDLLMGVSATFMRQKGKEKAHI